MSDFYNIPFPPNRTEKCFCQSDLKFKHCCGNMKGSRKIPHGIQIIEKYLTDETCDYLTKKLETLEGERLTVVDLEKTTKDKIIRSFDDRRITEKVLINEHQEEFNKIVEDAVKSKIETSIEKKIEWYEKPQILRYHPNGFYQAHADCDNMDPITMQWRHDLDRDISLLIYLNEDYEGGTLYFTNFDYRIKPKKGMLVFFPSDFRYQHAAENLISGTRYAIVSWSAILGNEKVRQSAPDGAIKLA